MANEENLTSWVKGQSGNPKGKPKGARNRSTIVREWLEAKATDGKGGQVVDQLTRALIQKAAKGDVQAFKELFDSGYGKLTDKVENTITLTKMGEVVIEDKSGEQKAIEFDIGSDANDIKQD